MRLVSKLFRRNSRVKETILAYRHTFNADETARWTLARLLEGSGLLRCIENEEQRVLHNNAVYLLENMGMTQGENYDRLVEMLFTLSIPPEAVDS